MDTTAVEDHFWKDVLGNTATITTICQFLSGMFTVKRIVVSQSGSVGDLSVVPFLMGALGCALWLIYGYLKDDPTIINCNIVGTILMSFYVTVFMKYTTAKTLIFRQVSSALIFITLVLVYANIDSSAENANPADVVFPPVDSRVVQNLGLTCVVISILGCASPLVALKEVMRTKSTETLPFPLILAMFLVCFQWWLYGIITHDFYMQFTNFIGTVLALAQLSLFCIFSSSSSQFKNPYGKLNS